MNNGIGSIEIKVMAAGINPEGQVLGLPTDKNMVIESKDSKIITVPYKLSKEIINYEEREVSSNVR